MPIQPIDLQNLFMRISQIGKEQAQARDIAIQHQSVQNSEYAKEIAHHDRSVNETEELTDGPERTKDKEEGAAGKREEKKERKNDPGNPAEDNGRETEPLQDPFLGHHIDISG
ncbi:MAG: hypothetical protein E4H36_08560 [Spirochaetales bacterium]|nr:MAG: hypothetical protein E4H36_08560 [Spirochaetales bacterium]